MGNSPKQLGFKVPAEWEAHESVWLAWPHDTESFPGSRLAKVELAYVEIIKSLLPSEKINLLVLNQLMKKKVLELLENLSIDFSNLYFHEIEYVDVWTRDYGPVFTTNGINKKFLKFKYDGYNKQFLDLLRDDMVFRELKDQTGDLIDVDFILEGGAVETNGHGLLMTTKQCLLKNRNLDLSQEDNQNILLESYGADHVIWLNQGLVNDHTDGHIDEIARFVTQSKVLLAWEEDMTNPNYQIMQENYDILENYLISNNKDFQIIKLPLPHIIYDDGTQAPASYTNFYISNTVVLVPQFNDPNDEKALHVLQECFPNKEIIGIDCSDLIYGGGAIHCITMQEPK